ncbi:DNA-binding protein RFXANK [Platysternon megacephalum]|uniref:DNA-binding protein RFXANK n=1 Tax=Platysternon megacephalum TaxID=55544 RepID=A0A4D9DQS2_9SAUR|nr:DNA-binding protein RFXANK [Platysternon megacephalum]
MPLLVTVGPVRAESPQGLPGVAEAQDGTNAMAKRETRRVSFRLGCACVAKFFLQLQLRTGKIKISQRLPIRRKTLYVLSVSGGLLLIIVNYFSMALANQLKVEAHTAANMPPSLINQMASDWLNVFFPDVRMLTWETLPVDRSSSCEVWDLIPAGEELQDRRTTVSPIVRLSEEWMLLLQMAP